MKTNYFLSEPNGSPQQVWNIYRVNRTEYGIQNVETKTWLTAPSNGGTLSTSKLDPAIEINQASRWKITKTSLCYNFHGFRSSLNPELGLDLANGNTKNGSSVLLYKYYETTNQVWFLQRVS
ncbi:hypothetical protein V8C35DRAFT_314010 [Trichoderma chlorosporum]